MRYLLVLLLFGCAQPSFYKEGATSREFDQDSFECERDVSHLPNYRAERMYEQCMRGKGWSS